MFVWLLGAVSFVVNRQAIRVAAALSPLSGLLFLATTTVTVLAAMEYEGLAFEDDWYGVIAALLGAVLVAVAARNIRRRPSEPGL